MRNRRAILYLLLLIALLTGANLHFRYGAREVKAVGRQLLVEDADGVRGIRLERKGAAAVVLRKEDQRWRLVEPYSASVDEQAVMKFIDVLSMTQITDVIGDSALLNLGRSRADFALEDPALGVVLQAGPDERTCLSFGSKTPLADGVYVSIGGLDSVFVVPVSVLETVDVNAERFRRRTLFTFDENAVASFGIKRRADPLLEFARDEAGWRIGEAQASSRKVAELLKRITAASAESFVWPIGASNETDHASAALLVSYGLDPDTAVTVTLKGVDGADRRISFGKEAQEGRVYALAHGGKAIVTLPSALKALVDQDEGAFTDSRLFPSELKSVGSFTVTDHDVLYAFAGGKDGAWSLESPIIARAADDAVNALLSRILSLSSSDVTASEDGVGVSLSTNAAKTVVSRASVFGKMKPEDFRSREIIRIDPAIVKRIVRISGEGGQSVSVVYDRERKAWNLENGGAGAVPDPRGIEKVLSVVNPLSALRVEKLKVSAADLDDYGLDKPFLTVAIDQDVEGAVRRNIIIGKRTRGGFFATVGSSDAVFVIKEQQVRSLSAAIVGK